MWRYWLLWSGDIIAGFLLLLLTIKIVKKKFVNVEEMGKIMLRYTLLIFAIPWLYWIYNITEIMSFQKSPWKIIASQTSYYVRHPFVIIFSVLSVAYLIPGIGIKKLKNWGKVTSICITSIIALLSLLFCGFSVLGLFFARGQGMDDMVYGIFAFVISPLVFLLVSWPNLLFLYSLTRPKVKEQFR